MDPTIVVAAITGCGSIVGYAVTARPRRPQPEWAPPAELTEADRAWLTPQLALTGKHWTRQQVGR